MESMQEQMKKARAEQEYLSRAKDVGMGQEVGGLRAATLDDCLNQTQSPKQAGAREALRNQITSRRDTLIRQLVILQKAEDKLDHLRLVEVEAVQAFLDAISG
jgi:hypothetical protein